MTNSPSISIAETERLSLRRFTFEDAAFMLELMNTPAWLLYIGDRGVDTLEKAREYLLNGAMKSYEQYGYGPFVVCLKTGEGPIGVCGLYNRPTLEDVDIGFAFLPAYSGQGYAYEAAAAVMVLARQVFQLERIVAITLPENERSIKLLEKVGLTFEKMIQLSGDKDTLMLYAATYS
ncbi:MAG: alanine acetyltransferase [Saprospiraceae bacterium]|nr:MAG: alanine acetyltransferase [Saprospiraceae bacterium]